MASCINEIFESLRLRCVIRVKATSERIFSELASKSCAELLFKCHPASPSATASSCVGRRFIKEGLFSVSHLLYIKKQLRRMAYRGYVTEVVLFNDVAVF